MSRVDQAMKRAARNRLKAVGGDDFDGVLAQDLESFAEEETASLDHYPAEQQAVRRMPVVVAPAAGPAQAPVRPQPIAEASKAVAERPDRAEEIRSSPPMPVAPRAGARPAAVRNRWQEQPDTIGPRLPNLAPEAEGKTVLVSEVQQELVDQFDRAGEALRRAQANRGTKIVMVSSALPGEGRTMTAVNLALTLTDRGKKRVLLVDADLVRPSLDRVFSLPNVRGLTDALLARTGSVAPAKIYSTLSVLTSGSPVDAPLELLVSHEMRDFLAEASARFDWVVLDSPAGSEMPDVHLLAWLADGVLLVANSRKTDRKAIRRIVDELGEDRLIGVALNRVAGSTSHSRSVAPRAGESAAPHRPSGGKTLFTDN